MSGDVALVDAGDGAISRLVRTASALFARADFAPAALVGGLAVTMRLATVHRATNDVDTVSDGDRPREVALEFATTDSPGTNRIEIDGVKVDVMSTSALPTDADELPDDDLQRLFVLGHRWALDTAEALGVTVVDTSGSPVLDAHELSVATVPALIACKFHAIADRRDARGEKRESDALDLVRLIGDLVQLPTIAEQFSAAPFDLVALVSWQTELWLIGGAVRTARLLSLGSGAGDATMNPDDISAIGTLFSEMLSGR